MRTRRRGEAIRGVDEGEGTHNMTGNTFIKCTGFISNVHVVKNPQEVLKAPATHGFLLMQRALHQRAHTHTDP